MAASWVRSGGNSRRTSRCNCRAKPRSDSSLDPTAQTYILAFTSVFIALIAGYVGGWLGAASESDKDLARSNSRAFLRNAPIWMIGALASAAFYVWGITLLEGVSCNLLAAGSGPCAWQRDVATTFIVGWGILSQLVATVLFVAFRVIPRGEELSPDLDREWLARLSAQKIRMAIAWTLFAAGALLFRHVLVDLLEYVTSSTAAWDWLGGVSGIVGAISGAIAILGGRAANTGYRGNPARRERSFPSTQSSASRRCSSLSFCSRSSARSNSRQQIGCRS